jgi:hypothetical protein
MQSSSAPAGAPKKAVNSPLDAALFLFGALRASWIASLRSQ